MLLFRTGTFSPNALLAARFVGLGRGHAHWYDHILIALGAAIAFPDLVLDYIGAKFDFEYSFGGLVIVELLAIGIAVATAITLQNWYPKVQWWHPFVSAGLILCWRGIYRAVVSFLGFDD